MTPGMVSVRDLTPLAVQTARDAMKETPVMANQMLSVGRMIWDWVIPLGLAVVNPFDKVKDFDIPDRMCPGRRGWSIMSERTPGPTWCAWSGLASDVPTRQRPDPHVPRTSRSQRPMVPAKENPQAPARLSHSTCRGRRARAGPLCRNAGDVHELPMAEADQAFPRGSLSLLTQGRAIYGRRTSRWLAARWASCRPSCAQPPAQ
jgi:hypothetical protein